MAPTSKLSDLHYVLLAIAANRPSGSLLPPSTSVKLARASLTKAIRALIARGFAEEVAAKDAENVWREEGGQRFTVVVTEAGRVAVNHADGKAPKDAATAPRTADTQPPTEPAATVAPPQMAEPAARAGTKQALLIGMLQREGGASIPELAEALGWLPHTTRAALTGLRKKGHTITCDKRDGVSRYHIATAARPMGGLAAKLAALATMSPAQLRDEWQRVHGAPAPVGFSPDLIARGIADRLQAKAHGGLTTTAARQLAEAIRQIERRGRPSAASAVLKPGTQLAREWHGHTHHVLVLEDGFDYCNRRYHSLTAIAREITGAAWSGPRFFGLTSRGAGEADDAA